jgi:hypothetical protein
VCSTRASIEDVLLNLSRASLLRPLQRWRALRGALLGVAPCGTAGAQDAAQPPTAAALFEQGQSLVAQGQYAAACQRFEQSQALDPGGATLLYLGDCYERAGRTASAWTAYRAAASASSKGMPAEHARVAAERAQRLTPQLATLVLVVPAEDHVSGFELSLNGKPLSPALQGAAFPLDPGRYQLLARAPGRDVWSTLIEVGRGGQQRITVPPLAVSRGLSPSLPPGAAPSPAAPAREKDALAPSAQQVVSLVLAGAGVLSLTAGVVFGVYADSAADESTRDGCSATCVTRQAASLDGDADAMRRYATLSHGIGAGALAAAAILYLTGQPDAEPGQPQAGLRITPGLAAGGGVLHLGSAF